MKKLHSLLKRLGISLFVCLAFACSDDDSSTTNNQDQTQLTNTMEGSNWVVTLFEEDNVDQTTHFSNYTFKFEENGGLSATNGETNISGTWTTGLDDSTPKLILNFNAPDGPFEEISEDWRLMERDDSRIRLKHISGGDGSEDLLTFEKMN